MAKTKMLRLVAADQVRPYVVHWRPVAMLDLTVCGEPAAGLVPEPEGQRLGVCARCLRAAGLVAV